MNKRKKILWLASWYPSKLYPYNGDFIQRHAEAVSLYHDIHIIHVVKDEEGRVTKNVLKEEKTREGFTETLIYYHIPLKIPVVKKWLSSSRYGQLYAEAIETYTRLNGCPDLVHVHTGMKAGIAAYRFTASKNIPYVVTEHWTGFLDEAGQRFGQLSVFTRRAWKKIAAQANSISFVSQHLLNAFTKKIPCRHSIVIPNVVNRNIFYPGSDLQSLPPRFIHISGLDDRKQPALMLEAFSMVKEKYPKAQLDIFGSTNPVIAALVRELKLEEHITLNDEVPQTLLAGQLRQSLALVLYSKCETFGCVIIEANACGIPVIVSDIPVFHETVREGINGYFAVPDLAPALARRMEDMIANPHSFDSNAIVNMTLERYSYEVVGQQFSDWYEEVLKNA